MKKLIFSLLFIATSIQATENYVTPREQVRNISDSLENTLELEHYTFEMSRIRIRTRLEWGIDIPLIAKFKVKPEIELYYTK